MSNALYSPVGNAISCKSWEVEALLRMLLNSLDPRVAEKPEALIVYGGTGRAARDEQALQEIIEQLRQLESDETLLIQSGKPIAKFTTYPEAARVVMSVGMLVPNAATPQSFDKLERSGLTMYGQATAASWAYIGVQGILQTTFETMSEVAEQNFKGSLVGRIILTSGLGGMGSAQPLSITMLGGVAIVVELDEDKIDKRLLNNYCDIKVSTVAEAIYLAKEAAKTKRPLAIALVGNAPDVYQEMLEQQFIPDVVTDQTAAHDLLNGYIPKGLNLQQAMYLRQKKRADYIYLARQSVVQHVKTMIKFQQAGAIVFEYGNNIRGQAHTVGLQDAFAFPGFIKAYIRPLYNEGGGPCRWIALSGNPKDIYKIDEMLLATFGGDKRIQRWINFVQEHLHFKGLPARTCWLNYEERNQIGKLINQMVATGELSAPIAITRDHSEGSTIAAPRRETEGMKDGSDAVADWPLLLAMLSASAGATLVSVQHGGGVGIGNSIHSGMTAVADGSFEALEKLSRVLSAESALNIIRHADAGYTQAAEKLKEYGIRKPL